MDSVDKTNKAERGEAPSPALRQGFATTEEAGRFLGLTRQAVSVLIFDGKIPARRYGKRALRIPWAWLYEEERRAREERPAEFHRKLSQRERRLKGTRNK
jgi:hypothetical protein